MTAAAVRHPIYRPALLFGLLLGGVLAVLLLTETLTGWYRDFMMIRVRMLSPVALFVVVAAAVWHLGRAKWRQRLGGALLAVAVAAIGYALATYLVVGTLFPDYLQTMQEHHRQGLVAQGKAPAEIAATLARHERSVGREAADAGLLVAEVGAVASLLFASIIRRGPVQGPGGAQSALNYEPRS